MEILTSITPRCLELIGATIWRNVQYCSPYYSSFIKGAESEKSGQHFFIFSLKDCIDLEGRRFYRETSFVHLGFNESHIKSVTLALHGFH